MALSMQMYKMFVMMKTLYRCRNASVSEVFTGRRHFVREWEPRFVGLLTNVLSCRRKDDIPAQLPVHEELVHESQSSETVIDDIMTNVNVLRMESGTQQHTDSNLVPVQIGAQPKSKGKSNHGKDARIKSSEKVKDDVLQKGRSYKVPEQCETEGPGRCRREASDCKLPTE